MAAAVSRGIGSILAFLGVGTAIAGSCLYTVDGGHRAIIFDRWYGVKQNVVKGEGMHFYVPILQRPIIYETRTRFASIPSETGTKDLQTVSISLRLLYRPVAELLPIIHQKLGPDYDDRVLPSVGNEVLKSVVAQYDAVELITMRETVSSKIREQLTERAKEFGITLDDVSLTHMSFSPEFNAAIEHKQVAQQDAERSKFLVLKVQQEQKANILKAQGASEAAKLIEDAMKDRHGYVELKRIEAAREIADSLSKSRNVTYLPSGGNFLMNLPGLTPGPNIQSKSSSD